MGYKILDVYSQRHGGTEECSVQCSRCLVIIFIRHKVSKIRQR